VVEEAHDAERRGAAESGKSGGEASEAGGGDTVGIFFGSESEESGVFIEMLGERVLQEDAVDVGVLVEALDVGDEFVLGGGFVGFPGAGFHAGLLCPGALHADVGETGGVLSGDDGFEAGGDAVGDEAGGALGDLGAEFVTEGFSVEELGRHEECVPGF